MICVYCMLFYHVSYDELDLNFKFTKNVYDYMEKYITALGLHHRNNCVS